VWEYAGLREWVAGLDAAPAAGAEVWQAPVGSGGPDYSGALLGGRAPRFPVGAIVLLVAVAVTFVDVIADAVAIPTFLNQRDKAKESAIREGVHSIQIGVQSWAVDHEDQYPDTAIVSPAGMDGYVTFWPTNPYSGSAMTQGTAPGQFTYTVSDDGRAFRITAYGSDGAAVITVP
jgi:hypothetical protein